MSTLPDWQGLSNSTSSQLAELLGEKISTDTISFLSIASWTYLAILYFLAKASQCILRRRSQVYSALSWANQRTCDIYVLNIVITATALILQLVAAPALVEKYTVLGAHCIRVASMLIIGLYLFELVYRQNLRYPMLVHHFSTIFAIFFVNEALQKTGHPSLIVTGLLWLFQATTEQSVFVALLMYRLRAKPENTRLALRFAAVQSLLTKFASTTYLLVWFGLKQARFRDKPIDYAFSVVLCLSLAILFATQIWGAWVVWKIGDDLERRYGCTVSRDVLASEMTAAAVSPAFEKEMVFPDSSQHSLAVLPRTMR